MQRIAQGHLDSKNQPRLIPTRSRAERGNPQLVARMAALLRGANKVPRRVLREQLGVTDDALRAAARFSNGMIVGLSGGGYALTAELSASDVNHAIAEMLSRANELRRRAVEVRRVLNSQQATTRDVA